MQSHSKETTAKPFRKAREIMTSRMIDSESEVHLQEANGVRMSRILHQCVFT
jgi:hypothetical protein